MGFEIPASAYNAFMGEFSEPLAEEFLTWSAVPAGSRVLDVGCGPGALTQRLVDRFGADAVSAVDPSRSFVAAARERFPGVDVQEAVAEELPFPDHTFDAALAQLVVHFMQDPVGGLREMARVCRPGGVVTACVWDHSAAGGPLAGYWAAVRELDPSAHDESEMTGAREGDLLRIADEAGLREVTGGTVSTTRTYASFEEWWHPYTLGVGPAGAYVRSLDDAARERLRQHCATKFPTAPFDVEATAWAVRGTV